MGLMRWLTRRPAETPPSTRPHPAPTRSQAPTAPLTPAPVASPAPAVPTAPSFDTTLTPVAQRWMESLPPRLRPQHLGDAYPRIANRLALVWNDPKLSDRIFDSLLVDRRGGRRGFPPEITAELLQLHDHHQERSRGFAESRPLDGSWGAQQLQATADR